jgi:hypothetical protein
LDQDYVTRVAEWSGKRKRRHEIMADRRIRKGSGHFSRRNPPPTRGDKVPPEQLVAEPDDDDGQHNTSGEAVLRAEAEAAQERMRARGEL